jgi:uncharacterized membrane protein YcaP (DUF421 family)
MKLRLTVDKLEMRLRLNNVKKMSDVNWATMEANGQIGYELKQDAQPATKKDIQELINLLNSKFPTVQSSVEVPPTEMEDIFQETTSKKHNYPIPKRLQ